MAGARWEVGPKKMVGAWWEADLRNRFEVGPKNRWEVGDGNISDINSTQPAEAVVSGHGCPKL